MNILEGEFDIQQKGISPLLDKKAAIEQIEAWEAFLLNRKVGIYISSDIPAENVAKTTISMATLLGFEGEDTYDDEDLFEVEDDAHQFLNTYFSEEGYYWGFHQDGYGFGYFKEDEEYHFTLTAMRGRNASDPDECHRRLREHVYGEVMTIETSRESKSSGDEYLLTILSDNYDLTTTTIMETMTFVGYREVHLQNEG